MTEHSDVKGGSGRKELTTWIYEHYREDYKREPSKGAVMRIKSFVNDVVRISGWDHWHVRTESYDSESEKILTFLAVPDDKTQSMVYYHLYLREIK